MNENSTITSGSHVELTHHVILLTRGTMELELASSDFHLADLIRMAERQNPKRGFLFVSTVLGRHIPVSAGYHRMILERLAQDVSRKIDTGSDVLVMGYAETAVGLGAGVHDALRKHMKDGRIGYLPTTRHPGDRDVWCAFSEDHSHVTGHSILQPVQNDLKSLAAQAQTLVLVDDEATTGKTFTNLISALASVGRTFKHICLVTLTDWSAGDVRDAISSIAGCENASISSVSLIEGRWNWTPVDGLAAQVIPTAAARLPGPGIDRDAAAWRAGISGATHLPENAVRGYLEGNRPSKPVLVIGTGEYVWQAFRMAEQISEMGWEACFLATTRSPVLKGETVREKVTFSDHYGLGVPMYLHNVMASEWGSILLMVENEEAEGIDPILTHHLSDFAILTPSGRIIQYKEGKPCT
ncbi:phosphoribosyltransferase family protein [Epibacterium sp. DP7N7-1]|nr:phosphoribosyltransferase family protein [Epibacterium sp. DP7N7-1]